jgi:hypothetical protein
MNLRLLLEAPAQIRRLASDMVITVALFQGEPDPGAELIQRCLPGLLSHLAESGDELADAARVLREPGHLISVLKSADWAVDDDLAKTLGGAEAGPVLRRWSAILDALVAHSVIGEELERRAAQAQFESCDD